MYEIITTYKNNMLATRKSNKTIENYSDIANRFVRFVSETYKVDCDTDINKVTGDMVKAWIAKYRANKDSTRNLVIIATKSFLDDVYTSGKTSTNLSIALPKTKRIAPQEAFEDEDEETADKQYESHVFSKEEIKHLMDSCPNSKNGARTRAIIALLLGSGMRVSEVASLNVSNFSTIQSGGYVKCIRKGGALKRINIAEFVGKYISEYLKYRSSVSDNDPLFVTSSGNRMSRFDIYNSVGTVQKKNNVKTGIHKFRHTVLTEAEKIGGAAVSRDIGNHHSLQITNRYVHSNTAERTQTINSLGWKDVFSDN